MVENGRFSERKLTKSPRWTRSVIGVSRLCRLAAPGMMIAIRSIFSTCNALCQGGLLTLLDVPPSICYPSGRRWRRRGPKPGEQRNPDLRIGRECASRHDDCQHQGGRGPAVRGKVNSGEVLIKVVEPSSLGRVDLGGCPPRSPTDPGLHITRTRFLIS